MIFSENRDPLFGIMLYAIAAATRDDETPGVPLVPESACKVRSRTSRSIPFMVL